MIKSELISFLSSNISDLICSGKYESFICDIMNESFEVFESKYMHIDSQNKGEPDIIDIYSNKMYDVKLLLTTKQGQNICSNNKNIESFSNWIIQLNNECYDAVVKSDKIDNTLIYKIFKDLTDKIQENENLIVFFIFPFMCKYSKSRIENIFCDYLDVIYNSISDRYINRDLYVIYPTIDNCIALRRMRNKKIEYMEFEKIKKYFCVLSNKYI